MDYEQLLQGSKWEIIQELAKQPRSTSFLAKKLGTSQANISQQIKLLEIAGFVRRRRGGQKGSHFTYEIIKDFNYLVHLSPHAAQKKAIQQTPTEELMFKTMLHTHSVALMTLFMGRPDLFGKFKAVGVFDRRSPEIFVITDDIETVRSEHAKVKVQTIEREEEIVLWSHTEEECEEGIEHGNSYFLENIEELQIFHDPDGVLAELKKKLEERGK